ncbi:MAG: sigma 54-interacting transcriptional regulator [Myxococcales bacterium]|nr:sigma 54-interacting transcriptional regulator [Myxococcales bacterium]
MTLLAHPRYLPGPVLGRGGQAVVLRVTDREAPARALVAKLWQPGAFDEDLLRGEFALLARMHVPGLVRAHDLGRDAETGAPFLVEDFIDGPDAREWLSKAPSDRARSERLARALGEVTATLAVLHDSGFLHGDLKPAHVRVPDDGRATLLDLGAAVARARAEVGPHAMTPGYAAPELCAGARPSPRTDLFALGALAFSAATGKAPESARPVRELAPWLPPSLGDLVDRLRATHPEDRPHDAREVLEVLGQSVASVAPRPVRSLRSGSAERSVREAALGLLDRRDPGLTYLTGAAGMGKSHVLSEWVTRALLAGRAARWLRFPHVDAGFESRLIAWLRGAEGARPFAAGPLWVALDDVHTAPAELGVALEAFRCRRRDPDDVTLVAAVRTAPNDSPSVVLEPLDLRGVRGLCAELSVEVERASELLSASGGNPGLVAALAGKAPLTRETVLERAKQLTPDAVRALGALAAVGGSARESMLSTLLGAAPGARASAELAAAGLVERRSSSVWSLVHAELRDDLASALVSSELARGLAEVALSSRATLGPAELVSLARFPAPAARAKLLALGATRAQAVGLRSIETEALLGLAADPEARTPEVLTALDRSTRGGGSAGLHPELLEWLDACPSLTVLALRRRAEQTARAGDHGLAAELSARALAQATSPADRVLALSTAASTALYRADWTSAETALADAKEALASAPIDDTEELARLDHNRGVVALYRARVEEARDAFEQSLAAKRAMGDRGGTWACLLNLALARGQLGEFAAAEEALLEAVATCRALGQLSGAGWCLAALADVALRRGAHVAAERWVAEAEHLGDVVPKPVHADLALLRAELALVDGDGQRALAALGAVREDLLAEDALLAARALTLRARAHLCTLPADRKLAARTAIRAARRARTAGLPEPERRALAVFAEARRRFTSAPPTSYPRDPVAGDDALWAFLATASTAAGAEAAALALCRWVVEASGAERVFIFAGGSSFGVDVDGVAIADASARVPRDVVESALRTGGIASHPTVSTRGGAGSRLTAVGPEPARGARALLVLEHRFLPNAFDSLDRQAVERWALCATLAVAVGGGHEPIAVFEPPPEPEALSLHEPSTVLPSRRGRRAFPNIVGESPALGRALARLDTAVDSDLPVLVTGETGVGKELFARALHDSGPRARAPFVAINCGAVPDSLFEAELFGHARGSFTGADRARAGLIARAEGGTLFLDEIGELPLMRQATLLRALAERRYRPVGSDEDKPFDVRVIAATNRDLEREVEVGTFRRDLLYRLNVLEVRVPPLRERPEDILVIAEHVLAATGSNAALSQRASRALMSHRWPGNVRELEHQIQRVAALGVARVELEHLSREVRAAFKDDPAPKLTLPPSKKPSGPDAERDQVRAALEREGGNITRAAERLRLTRHGLKKKMIRLGLREPKASGG